MKSSRILLSCLLLPILLSTGLAHSGSRQFFTFGPMVHIDFGKNSWEYALGVEYAHWWDGVIEGGPMVGADIGVDFTGTRIRLYTEAQGGILAGASAGPFIEFHFGSDRKNYGLQASAWAAAVLGADMRVRFGRDGLALSPGAFAKYAGCSGGKCGLDI